MCLGTQCRQQAIGDNAMEQSLINADVLKSDRTQQQQDTEESPSDVEMFPAAFEGHHSKKRHHHAHHNPKHRKASHAHIIVHHDYHDHSHDPQTAQQPVEQHPARGGVTTPFPLKLHAMLDGVKQEGYEDVVSWQPHGRCFVVHKPQEFVALLPHYFKLSKLASFQRQLNLYGFQRLTKGKDRGGYYHEFFLRGRTFLVHKIQRRKVKGTGVRARSNPEEEPDFWKMEWMEEDGVPSGILSQANERDAQGSSYDPPSFFVYPGSLPVPTMLTSTYIPIASPASVRQRKAALASDGGVAHDNDVVCAFDRTFHFLDPFRPLSLQEAKLQAASEDAPAAVPASSTDAEAEAETFFQDFEFPDIIGPEIEDDAVFGEMLASLVA